MDNLLSLIYTLGKNIGNSLTLRQLSVDAGVPYTTANRIVKQNEGIFTLEKKGSSILCSLNIKDRITLSYLSLAERKKADDFCQKDKEMSVIRTDLPKGDYAAILFGSRAGGRNREKSDIDLMIINKDGSKSMSFSKNEMIFKLEINPIFMSANEFRQMLEEEERNLADEIIKNHIILYGEEYFWRIVLYGGI